MIPSFTPEAEQLLVRRLVKGEASAFKTVFELYKRSLFRFIMGFVKSETLAEELMHDVFLKVWESRERLNEVLSLSGYLHTIAKHHVFNYLKREARQRALQKDGWQPIDTSHNPVEDQITTAEYELLRKQAIAKLPPQRQTVYQLCRIEEQSYQEVSAQLGISQNAVKDHMVKAGKFLKAFFHRHADLTLLFLLLFG